VNALNLFKREQCSKSDQSASVDVESGE
jgi:hypothetical protein